MATKTFSGRAEEDKLAYADALTQREYGISYGQYCATVLLNQVQLQHALPVFARENDAPTRRVAALHRLREMSEQLRGSKLATMDEGEMKALVASRYE